MYPSEHLQKMKIAMIKKVIAKEQTIKESVEQFQVSRQTISKWIARYKYGGEALLQPKKSGPKNKIPWNKTEKKTEDIVVELGLHNSQKGPDWISDELEYEYDIKMNQSTVYRILKRRGLRYGGEYKKVKRHIKHYTKDIPGREIQLDASFPFGYQKAAIIFDAIDDCSRWVYGKIYEKHNADATISFLQELIDRSPFQILAIRTDQGTEFINYKVREFLVEKGIEHNINPPYTPQHNGKIERFHRTLKNDAVYAHWCFHDDIDTLNYKFSQFLAFYNYSRKHSGLGINKLTPAQKIAHSFLSTSIYQNVNLTLQQNIT